MIKRYHLLMITIILLILFMGAVHFFLDASDRYAEQRERVAALQGRLNFMKQQKAEMERKVSILARVNRFVDKAGSLGLAEERWSFYGVNVQEMVSYEEMAQIVNQCVNSASAYFEPEVLHVRSMDPGSMKAGSDVTPANAPASGEQTGDVLITLRGKFVVRQE